MKKLLCCICAAVAMNLLYAQKDKDLPDFGKVDKEDLLLKECDFDRNAEAMVLFDVGELFCNLGSNGVSYEFVRRVRIKVLKDQGKDVADIHLRFHSYRNDENIKKLSAQTYNLDGTGNIMTTPVDKKQDRKSVV